MWDAIELVGTEGLDGRHGSFPFCITFISILFMAESVSFFSVAVGGPILLFFSID